MDSSGYTLWFTGMSGAGKSTLARYVAQRISLLGGRWELLDASELEMLLPEPPDASREVRDRNTRLLGWMAALLTRQGVVTLVAATSPHRDVRDEQRKRIGRFAEIFVDCPFETLLARDEADVYRKAMAGKLQNVVGVQAPYEPPLQPEVAVDTEKGTLEELSSQIFQRLFDEGFVTRQERDVLLGLAEATGASTSAEPEAAAKAEAKAEEAPKAAKPKATAKAAPRTTKPKAAAKAKAQGAPAAVKAAKPAPKAASKPRRASAKAAPRKAGSGASRPAPTA